MPDADGSVARTAAAVLRFCRASALERIALLTDDATAPSLLAAFGGGLQAIGAVDPLVISLRPRQPAFSDLPPHAVDAMLAAHLVIDLTTAPWLYSDSFTRFTAECRQSGTRLALIWGMPESLPTIAACPPSPTLARRAQRGLAVLNRSHTVRVRSRHGTDFTAEFGEPNESLRSWIGEPPAAPGTIGAPLCASVTAPFMPGTASGVLAFAGAGRFQGPENLPIRSPLPITLTVDAGRIVDMQGDHTAAIALADWFASAPTDDVFTIMDCNIGFDPRGDLWQADNTVVHSFAGGVMIGIGNPYTYRQDGSHRPGYHLDLMFPEVDVDFDDRPYLRAGTFVGETVST